MGGISMETKKFNAPNIVRIMLNRINFHFDIQYHSIGHS